MNKRDSASGSAKATRCNRSSTGRVGSATVPAVPVCQQVALQRRHADLIGRQRVCKLVRTRRVVGKEPQEQRPHLVLGRQSHFDFDVAAAGPDERWVQSLDVVRRHEHDAALLKNAATSGPQQKSTVTRTLPTSRTHTYTGQCHAVSKKHSLTVHALFHATTTRGASATQHWTQQSTQITHTSHTPDWRHRPARSAGQRR